MAFPPDQPSSGRERVVILGGGVGGITAAFALTQPELGGRYDVTLYQMGWRLGGKGASGRNADEHQRIEEHGLHIWLGFYYQAFANLKRCYEELGRDPAAPQGTFEKAFVAQRVGTLMDNGVNGSEQWQKWDVEMPFNTDTLTGGEQPSVIAYVEMMLQWMAEIAIAEFEDDVKENGLFSALWDALKLAVHGGATLLHDALLVLREERAGRSSSNAVRDVVSQAARKAQAYAHDLLKGGRVSPNRRRMAQIVDIACATVLGLYDKGVVTEGQHFQALDDMGLLEFLEQYGCSEASLDSPLLRGYFDLAFGFKRGELGQRHENAAAGTAIYAILRVCFEYRGAFMWRMTAGMGDTIFAPYYEVLRRRGVTFKFFHRVTRLEAGTDPATGAPRVERVHFARQVDVRAGDAAYNPLVSVKGLPCWPSQPLYEQIVQGDALRHGPNGEPYDLESMWSGWKDAEPDVRLEAKDFDHLVLAIPVGAHPLICADLMQASSRYREMVEKVQTVQTFGVQVWLDRDVEALGWSVPTVDGQPQPAVVDAYADPLNSFADNSHLLDVEDWPESSRPGTLLYFCGPLADEFPPLQFADPQDTGFPAKQSQRVKDMAIDWFSRYTGDILPGACRPGETGLNWAELTDAKGRAGVDRFDAQFWRANVDPSERYVLSVAGSTKYRLAADDSQFANLVLAGDWVNNGFAVGCVESATLGGLQAARAITGGTQPLYGEQTMETGRYGASRPGALRSYVPVLNDQQLKPPYEFKKLTIRSFPLRADPARLQQLVDRLNIAPPEVCEVRAISDLVFMQLAQYPYLESVADPEGWFTENELGFAIPVAIGKRVNGVFVPNHVAYHFAMFFVDNNVAIATGREVFGYHKVASELNFGEPGDPSLLSVKTLALPTLGSTERARRVQLVEVLETQHRTGLDALLSKISGMYTELGELVFGPAGLVDQSSPGLLKELIKTFGRSEIGIVSLKQFRDAAEPDKACYQAVVLSSFKVSTWHSLGVLPGQYGVRISHHASVPIVDAFGLKVSEDGLIKTLQPFAMQFDCTLTVGTNLYVAT